MATTLYLRHSLACAKEAKIQSTKLSRYAVAALRSVFCSRVSRRLVDSGPSYDLLTSIGKSTLTLTSFNFWCQWIQPKEDNIEVCGRSVRDVNVALHLVLSA